MNLSVTFYKMRTIFQKDTTNVTSSQYLHIVLLESIFINIYLGYTKERLG